MLKYKLLRKTKSNDALSWKNYDGCTSIEKDLTMYRIKEESLRYQCFVLGINISPLVWYQANFL